MTPTLHTTSDSGSTIQIAGTTSHFLDPTAPGEGRLRYLTGGEGTPLVLLHTVRTQAEHFRDLIGLVQGHYTVYALDLPGMGYSQIVPGASYEEPAMRAAVKRLMMRLDLRDVTLVGVPLVEEKTALGQRMLPRDVRPGRQGVLPRPCRYIRVFTILR